MILAWVLFLLLLGISKAIIGLLCCPPVGTLGLSALTQIPAPLEKYYEPELQNNDVKYDSSGFPVHPYTCERTVRLLSKTTEFYLNSIFFLAYPLAVCAKICNICIHKTNSDSVCSNECYRSVTTVRLVQHKNGKLKGPTIDMYYDECAENEDTQYVLNQLLLSQGSLRANQDSNQ